MPSVKIALDNLPDDAEVEVPFLGLFKNNTTTQIEDDRWQFFLQNAQGSERYENTDTVEISSSNAEQVSEVTNARLDAVQNEALADYKKSELLEMARPLGIEGIEDMKKDELVEAIRSRSVVQPTVGQHDANEEAR